MFFNIFGVGAATTADTYSRFPRLFIYLKKQAFIFSKSPCLSVVVSVMNQLQYARKTDVIFDGTQINQIIQEEETEH